MALRSGIFGDLGATPKYALNNDYTPLNVDGRHTMARMFVYVGDGEYAKFLQSVFNETALSNDSVTQQLARVVAGYDNYSPDSGTGYVDFLLQRASHSVSEKIQVVETLSDNYVAYLFGQAPPTFSYSGVLINTKQDDQAANMFRLYRHILRGTQLARRNKLVRLQYDGMVVSGTMLGLSWELSAETEMAVPFQFQVLVQDIKMDYNPMADPTYLNTSWGFVDEEGASPFASALFSNPSVNQTTGVAPVRTTLPPPPAPAPAATSAPAANPPAAAGNLPPLPPLTTQMQTLGTAPPVPAGASIPGLWVRY